MIETRHLRRQTFVIHLVVIEPIDRKHCATYMSEPHGVVPQEADEAVRDVDALWFDPDPKRRSGDSLRVIGYSHTANAVLTVILVRKESGFGWYDANGWRSNSTERRMYEEEG